MSLPQVRVNKIGQLMGAKGEKTRQCLIAAAESLMREDPTTPLTAAAISRHAKIAPPTFYVYFDDIKDLMAAVVEAAQVDFAAAYDILDQSWDRTDPLPRAQEFVGSFSEIWVRHHEALVLRNYEADKGDRRFLKLRSLFVMPFLAGLSAQIMRGGQITSEREAKAHALVFYTSLERLAPLTSGSRRLDWSTPDDLLHSQARMLSILIAGMPGPGSSGATAAS